MRGKSAILEQMNMIALFGHPSTPADEREEAFKHMRAQYLKSIIRASPSAVSPDSAPSLAMNSPPPRVARPIRLIMSPPVSAEEGGVTGEEDTDLSERDPYGNGYHM
jgi:hypothetical protein